MIDLFLDRRTLPVQGKRVSLAALFSEFGKTLLPNEAQAWNRDKLADELRERGYPVGLVEGKAYVGNLLLLKAETYIATGPMLRKVGI